MLAFIEREYPYIIDQINSEKALSDDLIAQIKKALDEFAREFAVTEGSGNGTK